ncbi:hypothetical protein [Gordonia sp. VNK21]
MPYLLALLVLCVIGFLVWRLLTGREHVPPADRNAPRGPDDDPDFLRKL